MSNIDGSAQCVKFVDLLPTTKRYCIKFQRSTLIGRAPLINDFLPTETKTVIYCKGKRMDNSPKLFLKQAFLGLGRAQVRRSQVGLMP